MSSSVNVPAAPTSRARSFKLFILALVLDAMPHIPKLEQNCYSLPIDKYLIRDTIKMKVETIKIHKENQSCNPNTFPQNV